MGTYNIFSSSAPIKEIYVDNLETWLRCSFYNAEGQNSSYYYPFRSGTTMYVDGEPLVDLIIPDEIVTLPNQCFYNYQKLNSVDLNQVTSIGHDAFG
jgi:hypothetical protein